MAFYALQEAVKGGRRDLVLLQLAEAPDTVKQADCNGTTCVLLAARLNNDEIVKELLSHGGDPHAAELPEIGANTALHFAARNKNEDMVACLLSFGASPNQQNALGQTPLHIAARVGCKGAAEQMLAAGANPAITDKSGFDAAYWAEHGKYSDLARLLPPPKCLNSKDLAMFQLLAMDQLDLPLKMATKKKGKGKKK
ncbi:ankyrin repeat-containing protein, putative [Eimeria mitis]|uniref:Ankyrin repeat-containing protein, putative n=1 Tax=Eimeria mitis TaxID=44415 RepID=U6JN56_9EIME|nr:ankyrin repeat-containing protein, putative [Eimeria mitis]CDJ26939.1 ankyrin repeat-containing protein, putative [Eimeria mitis]